MVVAGHHLAAQAGASVLHSGGNAVDAAITAAAILTVVKPDACGLGGDLFALIYNQQENTIRAYLGSGAVPKQAPVERFLKNGIPNRGPLASTVPGMVSAWEKMISDSGQCTLGDALEPSIAIASEGFPVSYFLNEAIIRARQTISQFSETANIFIPDGHVPKPGQLLRQPDLSNSLEEIAENGALAFYEGPIAHKITNYLGRLGSALSAEDLSKQTTMVTDPLVTTYRGVNLLTVPPVSPGLATLAALNILENLQFHPDSGEGVHLTIEAMKLALGDLKAYVADPSAININIQQLLDKTYASKRRRLINRTKALEQPSAGFLQKLGGDTAYVGVVDNDGNAVSLIQSVFWDFGSGVTIPGTGIVLNNRMSSFDIDPSSPNCVAPGKRALHTLQSLMLMKDKQLLGVMGCPGGKNQGQLQFNLQILTSLLNGNINPQLAVERPRWRFEGGKKIVCESNLPKKIVSYLLDAGHDIEFLDPLAQELGSAKVIYVDPINSTLMAAADPRREAYAIGF